MSEIWDIFNYVFVRSNNLRYWDKKVWGCGNNSIPLNPARTGNGPGSLKLTFKTGGFYVLKTHNYSYRGSHIYIRKTSSRTLHMNQVANGICFSRGFYVGVRSFDRVSHVFLRQLFSTPPPPPCTCLIFTYMRMTWGCPQKMFRMSWLVLHSCCQCRA